MTIEDFEEIIKPLGLLNDGEKKFLTAALKGNFNKWEIANQKEENKCFHLKRRYITELDKDLCLICGTLIK